MRRADESVDQFKALRKRIKSLEDYLGVVFSPDEDSNYDEHITRDYGIMYEVNEVVEEHRDKKRKAKKSK